MTLSEYFPLFIWLVTLVFFAWIDRKLRLHLEVSRYNKLVNGFQIGGGIIIVLVFLLSLIGLCKYYLFDRLTRL
jgi:Na+/H+ antiporter NhaC